MNKLIDISGIVLKTQRLILRPWTESDLDDFFEYASVDGVGQLAGWNPHRNKEESKLILDMFIGGRKTFALEYDGKVIGSLVLRNIVRGIIRNWMHYRDGKSVMYFPKIFGARD